MASTRLTRTPSSAGNQKTWTWSGWVKRSGLGSRQILFAARSDSGTDRFFLEFQSDDDLEISEYTGSYDFRYITDRKFRDTNAWYHIVVEVDTTQATASDRVKLYVNGVEETSFSTETNPSQNLDTSVNSNEIHAVGARADSGSDYFDGSMAHVHLIDGTAYDADTFGQTESSSGIWKPKLSPSVTYGTNGFFLKFQDSSSLGDDSSGNTNDFTVNGTGTQTLDTPSNVFCTVNSLINSSVTYSQGNNTLAISSNESTASTLGVTQGKWYFETKINTVGNTYIGVCSDNSSIFTGYRPSNDSVQINKSGSIYTTDGGHTELDGLPEFTDNDIIGCAFDATNKKIWWSKNGQWYTADSAAESTLTIAQVAAGNNGYDFSSEWSGDSCIPSFGSSTNANNISVNFGNGYFGTTAVSSAESDTAGLGQFEYSVPSGYYALCTKNIAEYG